MGAMTEIVGLEDAGEFFAPASTDMIDGLVGQYRAMRSRIEQVAALVTGETAGAISYFLDGNSSPDRSAPSVDRLFQVGGAVKALDSAYWSKALQLTDVLNYMPQARRDAWNRQLTAWRDSRYEEGKKPEDDLPPFDRGQWQAHVEHAAALLGQEGRLVAILPSGARNSFTLPGFSLQWHGPFDNQFPGASVSVVILVVERQP